MTITNAPFVPDELDHLLFATFPGLVIRKDLAQEIRGTSKAPSYVIEFMLGKYCANCSTMPKCAKGCVRAGRGGKVHSSRR